MKQIQISHFQTPVGELILGSYENQLCLADWRYRKMRSVIDERIQKGLDASFELGESEVISKTKEQLQEYFDHKRLAFELPLNFVGTDFQQQVWKALIEIPFGSTQSYLGLSKKMGNEKAIRAVAAANGANAISIIVPCHRIIGSDGELIGYAGGLPAKKKLLELENPDRKLQLELF